MSTEEKQNFPTFRDSESISIEYPKNEKEVSKLIKQFNKLDIPVELVGLNSKRKMGKRSGALSLVLKRRMVRRE